MRGNRLRGSVSAAAIILFAMTELPAQSTSSGDLAGLPPIIESTGAADPPDLPGAAPRVDNLNKPYLQRPANASPVGADAGVLGALDNLPPVSDATSRPSNLPAAPPDLPSPISDEANDQSAQEPRIVRFGDVRSESTAREQFPELRSRTASPSRTSAAPALADARPDDSTNRPRGFLSRFMPWRRQQPPEPPLITRQTPADGLYRSSQAPNGQAGRSDYSDRLDSELQKKADRVAKQLAGSRTNELDVQVVNEEVYIRARPMWFWQRRQLTDELRNLPGFDPKRVHVTVY